MADIFRAPLYTNRREIAPVLQLSSVFIAPTLLTTLLAFSGIPLPVSAAHCLPSQSIIKQRPYVNADTSRGTPKTLTADTQAPVFVAAQFAPNATRVKHWLPASTSSGSAVWLPVGLPPPPSAPSFVALPRYGWLPGDQSSGIPKPLTADAQAPISWPLLSAPEPIRSLNDTSRSSPVWLIPVGPQPLPPGQATPTSLVRFFWQPQDASAGTAKPLIGDAAKPFAVLQQQAPDRVRAVTDSSQGTRVVLFPVVALALPPGQASFVGPARFLWQQQDTSASVPVTLLSGVAPQPPVTVAQHFAPPRVLFLNNDSTSGTPKTLRPDAQIPFVNASLAAPGLPRLVAETSQATWVGLLGVVVLPLPPGEQVYIEPQRVRWINADTTRSTAKALIRDAQLPVFNPPGPPPDRVRPVWDTSWHTSAVLIPPPLLNLFTDPRFIVSMRYRGFVVVYERGDLDQITNRDFGAQST